MFSIGDVDWKKWPISAVVYTFVPVLVISHLVILMQNTHFVEFHLLHYHYDRTMAFYLMVTFIWAFCLAGSIAWYYQVQLLTK